MPEITIERLLIAPSTSPSSIAFAVPIACDAEPRPTPLAIGSFMRNSLYTKSARMFPRTPTIIYLDVKSMTNQPWFTRTCYISYNESSDWTNEVLHGTPRPYNRQLSMLSLWHSFLQVEPTSVHSYHSVDRIGNE